MRLSLRFDPIKKQARVRLGVVVRDGARPAGGSPRSRLRGGRRMGPGQQPPSRDPTAAAAVPAMGPELVPEVAPASLGGRGVSALRASAPWVAGNDRQGTAALQAV